jgi:hypothetical protein
LRLRYETKVINKGEPVEFPDFAFDFAYNNLGNSVEVTYLVPVEEEDVIKAQASEISAHLMGRYR